MTKMENAARLREVAAKVRQVAGAFKEEEPQVLYKGWIAFGPLFMQAFEEGAWQNGDSLIGNRLKRVRDAPGRDRQEWLDGLETPAWKPEAYFAVVEPLTSHLMPPTEEKEQLELEAGIAADAIEEEAKRIEAGDDTNHPPQTATPRKHLATWRDILIALDMQNNDEDRQKVDRLNETYNGPIIKPGQGKQPFADEDKLLEWWNGLENMVQSQANRARDTKETVKGTHAYGRESEVVPEISGSVKQRRRDREP